MGMVESPIKEVEVRIGDGEGDGEGRALESSDRLPLVRSPVAVNNV